MYASVYYIYVHMYVCTYVCMWTYRYIKLQINNFKLRNSLFISVVVRLG